jgi:hypothetical protein
MSRTAMVETRLESTTRARQIAEQLLAIAAGTPAVPPPRQGPSIDYPRLQHHLRWFDGVIKLYRAAARALAEQVVLDPAGADAEPAPADETDQLVQLLRRAHRILLEHPVAAKVAFGALVAQGRAFAATAEGAALRDRLARSPRLRRGSLLWRSLTMGMLDEHDRGELPATYLDNLLRAIDRADLEQILGKLQLRAAAP